MSAVAPYLKAIASRRTVYALKPQLPSNVTLQDVQSVVEAIIKDTPTAFNSQINRAIILTGAEHKRVWDETVNSVQGDSGKKRPASVRDEAFGTIVFFTDDKTTEELQAKFPVYASIFPQFADHSSGAAQIQTWTALKQLDVGGHLQHYNGYIKAALPKSIPLEWQVHSQLVFGLPAVDELPQKSYIENPVKIFS
ncbi:putative nitroreductase [Zygosaccharomyces mellis]|uniref:Putative nitroreductase n=1 Tax=Zygosaccharomyces mellis TaxID=42258 RepID=A0A4C2E754_9SACH|nr:putative nitroreductase [Zygosaccharomyces mellis]